MLKINTVKQKVISGFIWLDADINFIYGSFFGF